MRTKLLRQPNRQKEGIITLYFQRLYEKLNEKAKQMNKLLEKGCNQKQIDLIKHSNINTKRHLNRSRLHLNGYRKSIFIQNTRNNLANFK